jgi:hypothetical protein
MWENHLGVLGLAFHICRSMSKSHDVILMHFSSHILGLVINPMLRLQQNQLCKKKLKTKFESMSNLLTLNLKLYECIKCDMDMVLKFKNLIHNIVKECKIPTFVNSKHNVYLEIVRGIH